MKYTFNKQMFLNPSKTLLVRKNERSGQLKIADLITGQSLHAPLKINQKRKET